jgi:hypothetical protein
VNSRLASKNHLLPTELETDSQNKNSQTTSNQNEENENRKKKLELINDCNINPKILLKAKSSFYFDFYFLFVILILFFLVNIGFVAVIYRHTNDVLALHDYTAMSINLSYSQIEISLIYLITLLKRVEIKENPNLEINPNPEVIFNKKVSNFLFDKNNLTLSHVQIEGLSDYENQLLNSNACDAIIYQYETLRNSNSSLNLNKEILSCQMASGGIYKKGLVLGFESLLNNLVNSYNEKAKLNFQPSSTSTTQNMYEESIDIIFNSRKEVLEKNIFNTLNLLKTGTDKIFTDNKSFLDFYYLLFFILFIMLVLSYCFVYIFTKRSYNLLTRMERVLINLLE